MLHTAAGGSVTFNDARRFGAMDLWPTDQLETHWLLEKLGPEPLGNAFNETYFCGAISAKASPIKAVLLDQRVVAGLGNIYVCEALHRAGINPKRQAKRVSAPRAAALVPVIREVLSEAIAAGGSSLRITGRRMAHWAISSTVSKPTTARASPAAARAAAARSGESLSPGDRPSTVRNAKDSLIRITSLLTNHF